MCGIFINIDQRRSLVYITIYLFNCLWGLHLLFLNLKRYFVRIGQYCGFQYFVRVFL